MKLTKTPSKEVKNQLILARKRALDLKISELRSKAIESFMQKLISKPDHISSKEIHHLSKHLGIDFNQIMDVVDAKKIYNASHPGPFNK